MGGGARRRRFGFRRQRPVGRRVVLAVAVYPPSGDDLFPLRRRYRTIGGQPACRPPHRTLVNAPTARSWRTLPPPQGSTYDRPVLERGGRRVRLRGPPN